MRNTLKVLSVIAVVLGALALLDGFTSGDADAGYAVIGGGLFLAQGWITLSYLGNEK